MEQFRLSHCHSSARGFYFSLDLLPARPGQAGIREEDAVLLAEAGGVAPRLYTQQLARQILAKANPHVMLTKGTVNWLEERDGMRLALGMVIITPRLSIDCCKQVMQAVLDLPDEVILYWFTLCFYGGKQKSARRALRILLTATE